MRLDGECYYQLKSKMLLNVAGSDVTREYHPEVGNADGIYPLAGRTEAGVTRETKPKDAWQSTFVGQDVFRRASPDAAPRLETRSKLALAHPSESGLGSALRRA